MANPVCGYIATRQYDRPGATRHVKHAGDEQAAIQSHNQEKEKDHADEPGRDKAQDGQHARDENVWNENAGASWKARGQKEQIDTAQEIRKPKSDGEYAGNEDAGSAIFVAQSIRGTTVFAAANADEHARHSDATGVAFIIAADANEYARHADAFCFAKSAIFYPTEDEYANARRQSFTGSKGRREGYGEHAGNAAGRDERRLAFSYVRQ